MHAEHGLKKSTTCQPWLSKGGADQPRAVGGGSVPAFAVCREPDTEGRWAAWGWVAPGGLCPSEAQLIWVVYTGLGERVYFR